MSSCLDLCDEKDTIVQYAPFRSTSEDDVRLCYQSYYLPWFRLSSKEGGDNNDAPGRRPMTIEQFRTGSWEWVAVPIPVLSSLHRWWSLTECIASSHFPPWKQSQLGTLAPLTDIHSFTPCLPSWASTTPTTIPLLAAWITRAFPEETRKASLGLAQMFKSVVAQDPSQLATAWSTFLMTLGPWIWGQVIPRLTSSSARMDCFHSRVIHETSWVGSSCPHWTAFVGNDGVVADLYTRMHEHWIHLRELGQVDPLPTVLIRSQEEVLMALHASMLEELQVMREKQRRGWSLTWRSIDVFQYERSLYKNDPPLAKPTHPLGWVEFQIVQQKQWLPHFFHLGHQQGLVHSHWPLCMGFGPRKLYVLCMDRATVHRVTCPSQEYKKTWDELASLPMCPYEMWCTHMNTEQKTFHFHRLWFDWSLHQGYSSYVRDHIHSTFHRTVVRRIQDKSLLLFLERMLPTSILDCVISVADLIATTTKSG